jgi:hypothetical protein
MQLGIGQIPIPSLRRDTLLVHGLAPRLDTERVSQDQDLCTMCVVVGHDFDFFVQPLIFLPLCYLFKLEPCVDFGAGGVDVMCCPDQVTCLLL